MSAEASIGVRGWSAGTTAPPVSAFLDFGYNCRDRLPARAGLRNLTKRATKTRQGQKREELNDNQLAHNWCGLLLRGPIDFVKLEGAMRCPRVAEAVALKTVIVRRIRLASNHDATMGAGFSETPCEATVVSRGPFVLPRR